MGPPLVRLHRRLSQAVLGGVTALCGRSRRSSRTRPHTLGSGRLGRGRAPRGTGGREPRCPQHPALARSQPCLLLGASWGRLSHRPLAGGQVLASQSASGGRGGGGRVGAGPSGISVAPSTASAMEGAVSAAPRPRLCHRPGLRVHSQNDVLDTPPPPSCMHQVAGSGLCLRKPRSRSPRRAPLSADSTVEFVSLPPGLLQSLSCPWFGVLKQPAVL